MEWQMTGTKDNGVSGMCVKCPFRLYKRVKCELVKEFLTHGQVFSVLLNLVAINFV